MADTKVQEGDKVSWSWGGSHSSGTTGEVKAGEVTVPSHRGNEISKPDDSSSSAVHIKRSGNDIVKEASELNIEPKDDSNGTSEPTKEEEKNKHPKKDEKKDEEMKENSAGEEETKVGEKRKADEKVDSDKEEEEKDEDTKKQKTTNGVANGTTKKGPGRPKGTGERRAGTKKEKKAPAVGKAERKTRSQGTV